MIWALGLDCHPIHLAGVRRREIFISWTDLTRTLSLTLATVKEIKVNSGCALYGVKNFG